MRYKLTKYGRPQVIIFPAVIFIAMALYLLAGAGRLPIWAIYSVEAVLVIILIWVLTFFRDPDRRCPSDKNILFSPADGKITNIDIVEENGFLGSPALRIGIFLSIFDVHINRVPCNVKIEGIAYKKGKYKNALNPQSALLNESNDLNLIRTDEPNDKLIVRQISGAIARRIVCKATEGQKLAGGEKFGMIKFGSRTELYIPLPSNTENDVWQPKCLVEVGDKVKAGLTPLVKYEEKPDNQ